MYFKTPLYLGSLNPDVNEPDVIRTYESNQKSVPVSGVQNYDALIWIEDEGTWKICRRKCKVSFFQRDDDVLYVKYTDASSNKIVFQQAIYEDTIMDLKKEYYRVGQLFWIIKNGCIFSPADQKDFLKAECLQTGDEHHLIVVFCDKQKYDRAVSWYGHGGERPS